MLTHRGGNAARKPDGVRLEVYFSTCYFHLLGAIHTQNIYFLGGPDGLTATGTHIFPGTAGLLGLGVCPAELTRPGNRQLVSPFLSGTELFESGAGLGDGKANFLVVVDKQAPLLGFFLESLIMIGAAPAGILDVIDLTVVVDHFMDQGGDGRGNRAIQTLGPNIDFMVSSFVLGILPDLPGGEVTIGTGAGLDSDNGPCKCISKILFVQSIEGIFEKFGGLADSHL